MKLIAPLSLLILGATALHAETPRVVTSIAPVQALVADVMRGVGTPTLLMADPVSPHDYAMRPSQAKAISNADVIFYVGLNMEPWLEKSLLARGSSETPIALSEASDQTRLTARDLQDFGEHEDEHDHDEEIFDPHLWLDPNNALIWLGRIVDELIAVDPENVATYERNLAHTRSAIIAQTEESKLHLQKLADTKLFVSHDSTQYLEHAFDLNVAGAFSTSDGQSAGARSLSTLLGQLGPDSCVLSDITHPSRISETLPEGIKLVEIDTMGYEALDDGNYSGLLRNITQSLMECLD